MLEGDREGDVWRQGEFDANVLVADFVGHVRHRGRKAAILGPGKAREP